VWDQTSDANVRNYRQTASAYQSDNDLVRQIESTVPTGATIFQLPYATFPESGYELLRPYFHSSSLRWSFPAMAGRPVAAWQANIAAQPPPRMIEGLSAAGFDGILIHRFLLADRGRMEAALTTLLGEAPVISRNGEFSFFALSSHRRDPSGASAP